MTRKTTFAAVLVTMAFFLAASPALAASPPPIQLPAQMADYAAWPAWAHTYLTDVVEWQIMQGYPDGSMEPQGNITRAEFTAMLAQAMGNAQPDPTQTAAVTLTDVASTDWFYPTVRILAATLAYCLREVRNLTPTSRSPGTMPPYGWEGPWVPSG
ncbi:MAG: S-layer homology domain-containing protein [Peptococcaceae bacterium]|jgi:hypothetical protein|nr:S-layer homology domain-containing protein [Peptococcaceae bacterium]